MALPADPGLDRLLADPSLGSTAKTIAIALVKHWAWSKPDCWPSDQTIAGKVGKSQGHVQRCLRQLEDAGWIARQRTDEVTTGRRIWLAWRCPAGAGAQAGSAPAREGPPAPARDERIVVVKGRMEREEIAIPERPRPEPTPPAPPAVPVPPPEPMVAPAPAAAVPAPRPEPPVAPAPAEVAALPPPPPPPAPWSEAPAPAEACMPAPALPLTPEQKARLDAMPAASRDQVLTWLMLGDPILVSEANKLLAPPRPTPAAPRTLPEAIERIREDPSHPGLVAAWLARDLGDPKSYNGFLARCHEAWQGLIPVPVLQDAYRQATGPKVRNRGAIFMVAVRRRE